MSTKKVRRIHNFYQAFSTQSIEANIDFCGYERCSPNHSFGPLVREHYILHVISTGKGQVTLRDQTYFLESGDCFIVPKDEVIFYQADTDLPWEYAWIGLSGRKVAQLLSSTELLHTGILYQVTTSQFYQLFSTIIENSQKTESYSPILRMSHLYQLIHHLQTSYPYKPSLKHSDANFYLQQAIAYLTHYYHTTLSIQDLANYLHLSRSYLHQLFIKELNVSPKQYLTQLRIERAQALLTTTNYPIKMIANSVGYEDALAFSKLFKAHIGCSPSDYRLKEKGR